jgi:hypothetical protein
MKTALKVLVLLALLSQVLGQNARGLAANVTTVCSNGCDWNNPNIWDNGGSGGVPLSADYITFNIEGSYSIQVTSDITVGSFTIGVDGDDVSGKQTLEITTGNTFTSASTITAYYTTVIQVDANATLISDDSGTTEGAIILDGFASFGGSNPSLLIDYKGLSTSPTRGSLTMSAGSQLVVANSLSISEFGDFYATGTINGSLSADGSVYIGGSGKIGLLTVYGAINFDSDVDVYLDVGGANTFDQIVSTGTMTQAGDLYVATINSFNPLSHQSFYVFNYTAQRGGFSTVTKDCTVVCLPGENLWQIVIDQAWSALLYNDASTTLISLFTLSLCLFVTIF